jgi:serine/threonine-protein kinase
VTARPDPRLGSDLGPYRIERVIGRGGMGVVYLATDTRLHRRVALKLLTADLADDEAFRARFLRESHLAASIDHPNIIPVYEAGEIEGTYYLAMRYVEGTDLDARLRAGPLEPDETVHLLAQVASALDAANEAGLVHRDVKPANILVAPGKALERGDHAYLTDFGLTKHRGSQTGLTQGGSFMGTLDYIAPEQIEGKAIDGRADRYALACMTFQCLAGSPPFVRDTFPNAEEQALLNRVAAVPGGFAATCVRGSYAAVPVDVSVTDYSVAPVASPVCSPDIATGASQVVVRRFRPDKAYPFVQNFMLFLATRRSANGATTVVPSGDCAMESPAIGPWITRGEARGTLACYTDTATGDALLYWSQDTDGILVRARNPRGDSKALYSFFDKIARFIAP